MNKKTDCLNKTVKRTKIDPKSKIDSEPNFIFIKTERFFFKILDQNRFETKNLFRNRIEPSECPPLAIYNFDMILC